jgi:hypothetical protein
MVVFDVNKKLEEMGSAATKAEFETIIEPLIDFTSGTLEPFVVEHKQSSFNRYNCADSLDRVNLCGFYTALVCLKKWSIGQSVVDFLAKAFIASGNIISALSTNTSAIKIEAIRAFAPSIPPSASDTAVTLERRVQNVAFDAGRNEKFYLFTRPPKLTTNV